MTLVILFFLCLCRLVLYLEGQRRRVARERAAADNIRAWFERHPPARMVRAERAAGSAARGDYFPFDDDFPSNLPGE
jgi:hypothetical protein